MRIATWNVERVKPHGWKTAPAQRRRMREVNADIWVLTETHLEHSPDGAYRGVHTPPVPERRPADERWVGIWTRFPLETLTDPSPHGRGTVAVQVTTPNGPMIVYGCVISWANEPHLDDGSPATLWQAHAETIDRIDRDLHTISHRHPGVPVVVAGDFNQDRDGSGWYGTHAVRQQLGEVIDRHELACVTGFDVVAAGLLQDRHLIDHICLPHRLAEVAEVSCWEPSDTDGVRLSDHPTVAVDV